MVDIKKNLEYFNSQLQGTPSRLIAVSKTYPFSAVLEAYQAGQRMFGENKVQEMVEKEAALPKDIEWHLIGHLQTNKVKYIAPFVNLIHSVDSIKLLKEINKQGMKNNRVISCLLQIYIANEETKFGLSFTETAAIFDDVEFQAMKHVNIKGFMGMATNTADESQIKKEFASLKDFFDRMKKTQNFENVNLTELSMGMSGDYKIAVEEGSTMVRIGSAIFGSRNYI